MTTFWGGRKERKKKRTALFLLFAYFLCRRRFVAPFGPFPGKMEKKIKKEKFYFSNERNFDSTGRGRKLHQRADAHIYSLMAFYRGSRDSLLREAEQRISRRRTSFQCYRLPWMARTSQSTLDGSSSPTCLSFG